MKNKNDIKTTTPVAYTNDIPNTPFRFLWRVSKNYKIWIFSSVFVVFVVAIAEALSVLFIREVVERAEAGLVSEAIFFGMLYPVSSFVLHNMWRVSGLLGLQWVSKSRKDTYNLLAQYSFDHSHGYFSDRFAGSLMSKVGNIVKSVERLIIDFLWHHLEALVTLTATSLVIIWIDVYTGLIFQLLVVSLILLNWKLLDGKRRLSLAFAKSDTYLRGQLVDVFSNISATRQYAKKSFELVQFENITVDNQKIFKRGWWYSEYMRVVNSVVMFIFSLIMFALLSQRWTVDAISTGDFIAVMVLIMNASGILIFIGRIFNDTAAAYGEMEEGLTEIIIPHEIVDTPNSKKLKADGGEVAWNNVTFEYGANRVFDQFNLTIKPGQRMGLVGTSGAGKTTFVSLLLRQHELTSGAIEIDGQNISEVTQDSLRQNIAVVPQEPLLFHRTIRENIAYGKPSATKKEIEEVAKKAQAHDFIMELEEGYDTMVGERGVKLSGGQKQRVAIARAMLKDAPILVLDEATSALDSESEVAIQKALHELMAGKTVVAIAHRLSTLREMDRIIVLEQGKIVEDGNHVSLATGKGTYQKLWEHQAGGFLQE